MTERKVTKINPNNKQNKTKIFLTEENGQGMGYSQYD